MLVELLLHIRKDHKCLQIEKLDLLPPQKRLTRLFRMKTNLSSSFVVQRWQILFKFCRKIRRGLKKHWGKIKMAARVVSRVFWHPVSYCLKIRYAYLCSQSLIRVQTSEQGGLQEGRPPQQRKLKKNNFVCNICKDYWTYWRPMTQFFSDQTLDFLLYTVGPERQFAQITVERIARNLLDYNVLISNFDNYSSN